MELNEREAHCVARLLQGAIFGNDATDGCFFVNILGNMKRYLLAK